MHTEAFRDGVDICVYSAWPASQIQCGDQCIASDRNCICGEEQERLFTYLSPHHCCVDRTPDNITQCSIDNGGYGICPQGRVLDKTETCNGYCYNEYQASEEIGRNSQFHCGDKCVPCGKCAEATLDVKMDLMSRPVMRISLASWAEEVQSVPCTLSQISVTSTFTAYIQTPIIMDSMIEFQDKTNMTWISEGRK